MADPDLTGTRLKRYHDEAAPERDAAERLIHSLKPWIGIVPPGPILEVGAGTGIFTRQLTPLFKSRKLSITDRRKSAVEHLKNTTEHQNVELSELDVEKNPPESLHYSLICANHVAHQFTHPAQTLEKLAGSLAVDGIMLAGFPGEDSFSEWRATCLELGIPFTGRAMPETEPLVIHLSMGPVQVDFYEDQSTFWFDTIDHFLQHQVDGGSDIEQESRQLTESEKSLLNEHWVNKKEGCIGMTYHNVFLAVKRVAE